MGLIDRFFGNGKDREGPGGSASTQFRETDAEDSDQPSSRNAPRRELVQVVLRDTMRKHGIPSDWIESRVLSTVSRTGKRGLHMNFVVRKAHDRLLAYVFAFQDSFERELARYEPRASDWLLSLGWEFQGFNAAEMPVPQAWVQSGPAPLADAPGQGGLALPENESEPPKSDEDVERDLAALFAIRDAAMKDAASSTFDPPPDFQATQPFQDSGGVKK